MVVFFESLQKAASSWIVSTLRPNLGGKPSGSEASATAEVGLQCCLDLDLKTLGFLTRKSQINQFRRCALGPLNRPDVGYPDALTDPQPIPCPSDRSQMRNRFSVETPGNTECRSWHARSRRGCLKMGYTPKWQSGYRSKENDVISK